MRAGEPLTDEDRAGWLDAIADRIARATAGGEPLVLACSALKRAYRDRLRRADPLLAFVLLDGPRELLAARIGARTGHFMPPPPRKPARYAGTAGPAGGAVRHRLGRRTARGDCRVRSVSPANALN